MRTLANAESKLDTTLGPDELLLSSSTTSARVILVANPPPRDCKNSVGDLDDLLVLDDELLIGDPPEPEPGDRNTFEPEPADSGETVRVRKIGLVASLKASLKVSPSARATAGCAPPSAEYRAAERGVSRRRARSIAPSAGESASKRECRERARARRALHRHCLTEQRKRWRAMRSGARFGAHRRAGTV